MKLLRALRDVGYPKGTLKKGSIVFVTEENRIVQGYFMNEILHGYNCEYVDVTALEQEKLQRLEEVKGLQRKVESLTEYGNKASAHLRKVKEDLSKAWAAHNAEHEARVLMEATLERALLDHQPVVLPLEIFDSVNACLEVMDGMSIISSLDVIPQLFRDLDGSTLSALTKIRDFVRNANNNRRNLLAALVNGYTVEKSPEDTNEAAFRAGMQAIYKEMDARKFTNLGLLRDYFDDKLVPLIKEIYSK